jgi:hypothetical protein
MRLLIGKTVMKTSALAGIFVLAQVTPVFATSFYVALDTHSDQCRIMVTEPDGQNAGHARVQRCPEAAVGRTPSERRLVSAEGDCPWPTLPHVSLSTTSKSIRFALQSATGSTRNTLPSRRNRPLYRHFASSRSAQLFQRGVLGLRGADEARFARNCKKSCRLLAQSGSQRPGVIPRALTADSWWIPARVDL